jgi:hypothetical protein
MAVGSRSQTRSHRVVTSVNSDDHARTRNPVTTAVFEQLRTPTDTRARLRRFWVRIPGAHFLAVLARVILDFLVPGYPGLCFGLSLTPSSHRARLVTA